MEQHIPVHWGSDIMNCGFFSRRPEGQDIPDVDDSVKAATCLHCLKIQEKSHYDRFQRLRKRSDKAMANCDLASKRLGHVRRMRG